MENANRCRITIIQVEWILNALEDITEGHIMTYEKVRLEKLLVCAREFAKAPSVSAGELHDLEHELFSLLDSHPALVNAYQALISNQIITLAIKGLSYLYSIEKSRHLTPIELERKRFAEETVRLHSAELKNQLKQIAEW